MKAKWFGLANLLFFSLTASAFPHASLNQLVQKNDSECNQTSGDNGWRDLIQQVNLVARKSAKGDYYDGRGVLSKKAQEIGLSEENVTQIQKTVGDVVCPALGGGSQGTGFLIGQGGQIVTNAHVLIDDRGMDRGNLADCFWQNKENPAVRIPLEIGERSFKPFTRSTLKDYNLDLAVVRLKRKVPGARPFRMDFQNPIRQGDELLMISAFQERMPSLPISKEVVPVGHTGASSIFRRARESVAEVCNGLVMHRNGETLENDGVYMDCSGTHGVSGSPVFAIQSNGELVIKAVASVSGRESADNTPFTLDSKASKGESFTFAIQLNRDIVDQLESFEASNEKKRTASEESVRRGFVRANGQGI